MYMSLIKGGAISFISVACVTTVLLASTQAGAVTIRFTSPDDAATKASKTEAAKTSATKMADAAKKGVLEGASDPAKLSEMDMGKVMGEITALKSELSKEKSTQKILGRGVPNQVYLGTWNLDPTKTLQRNLTLWVQQAHVETGRDIKLIWNAPGPGVFKIPFTFKGTWDKAFQELGHAIEQTPQWPVKIHVYTKMNAVVVSAIRN